MNFQLTLLNFSDDQLQLYISELKKSNLPKEVEWEITDLLETAKIQIDEARGIGWLP